jgi:aspartyl-tRNA(Asn)/glutamyl-tRNA(Gln) amidotransferase subunit C
MIDKKEIQHIAKLARLGITPKEEERFSKDLSSILDYIDKLKEADVRGVDPACYAVLVENAFRKDEIKNGSAADKILSLAPDKKERFLKVKSILK